ncbi:MAG: 5-formyltetrahydrofolate cyclo-ligase [Desulfobulbaceae bacterium A2]|nr:MAG: 5-formyltetrahydrofolate cyclo-ligase [Desulfobulbaceae bacterium A2]
MPQRETMRREGLRHRDAMSLNERQESSRLICERFFASDFFVHTRTLLCYVSYRSEVATEVLLAKCLGAGRQLAVPLTLPREKQILAVVITDPALELHPGYCSIPEPRPELIEARQLDPTLLDLVLVPGAVFDPSGGRLGYGGGFYDRFLHSQAPQALRVALAYEQQLVPRVPVTEHDQAMDIIVTERRTIVCPRSRHAANRCL